MSMPSDSLNLAFERIDKSGMTPWVGGGDTRVIALQNLDAIASAVSLKPSWRVLDFGCGVGRLTAPLAELLQDGSVVGIDLVPRMIEFCRKEIQPLFPNTEFVLSKDVNPHYDQYLSDTPIEAVDFDHWSSMNADQFDLICAFSVLTHLDLPMATSVFELLSRLLRPGGLLFTTAFLDLDDNPGDRKLRAGEKFRDCLPDRLAWVVYEQASLLRLAHDMGLSPRKIIFGHWRGNGIPTMQGAHFQDAIVFCRPVRLPADFDAERYVALHPDLLAAGADGAHHYLTHGYFEGRSYR